MFDDISIYRLKDIVAQTAHYNLELCHQFPVSAKEYFTKAQELFAKEARTTPLKPYWGYNANTYYLSECEKD